MEDQTIRCCDCGEDFIWSAGEQMWYKERGYDPPKRCKYCRMELKRKRKRSDLRAQGTVRR